jgi:hypothetical protein
MAPTIQPSHELYLAIDWAREASLAPHHCRTLSSREIMPQGGFDLLQRPFDLIAGDHKWRGDADGVFMGVLG